ncbi:BLUF domain-containing protein [Methylobacterium sp. J-090]|uniref:BLUF domain-containing protein n=1 Tax=Methylobacterium sp. J-090 TaxID=2836666 RepID=UPI001FB8B7C3|nr:BLUF domain-containing protein [Methylobacterium sp. J-090]MCJ2079705.1 BLUF domain-containing protein [Methylobacterium sp. J-090]
MSDLYRLVYASKNVLQGSDAEIAHSVAQILAASQRNNARVDVTGALMFNAGAFAQVLEGPRQGVESTFERIQCDLRHGDVTVLQCGPAVSRSFTNWSMAFVGQSATGRARWEGIASVSGFDLTRLDGDAVFTMLHELVLDEEGVSSAGHGAPESPEKTDRLGAPLDVERVRAELPQPGQALQAKHNEQTFRAADSTTPRVSGGDNASLPAESDAVLTVLRKALAQERQLTTDLRNELDHLRIALALQREQSEKIHRERDLWAKRAQLLASAMTQEASAVPAYTSGGGHETSEVSHQDRMGASIKAVA